MKKKIKNILGFNKIKVGSSNESFRVNWLEQTLNKIPVGSKILDAGAGEQQFKRFCKHLNYVSQDFAQYEPEVLDSGLQMEKWNYGTLDIISDIASIPEKDESFDAIMCTEVFEHIINPREAIKEFSRLLKKDGYLIITAPFCSLTHFAPYHFYTGFNSFFYEKELNLNGFEIIELTANGNYFEYLAQEVNRLSAISEKYAGTKQNIYDKFISYFFLKRLQKLTVKDSGSNELLCFGIQILARKK